MRRITFILTVILAVAAAALTTATLTACTGPEPQTPVETRGGGQPAPAQQATEVPAITETAIPSGQEVQVEQVEQVEQAGLAGLPAPEPPAGQANRQTVEPKPEPEPAPEPGPEPMAERNGETMQPEAARIFDLGLEHLESGRYRDAANAFREAIGIQQVPSWTLERHAGIALQEAGETGKSIEHLTNAAGIRDTSEIRARRALLLIQQGNCGAALRDALEALRMEQAEPQPGFNPTAEAHWAAAVCREQAGRNQQALEHARRALQSARESGPEENLDRFLEMLANLGVDIPPASQTPEPLEEPEPDPTPSPTPASTPEPTTAVMQQPELPSWEIRDQMEAVENMRQLRQQRLWAFRAILEIPWVRDGLEQEETEVAAELALLFKQQGSRETIPILEMEFIKTIQEGDLEALRSLRRIRERSLPDFRTAMRKLEKNSGDEDTPRIAVLQAVHERNPELFRKLLEPRATIESGTTDTIRSGRIQLTVVVPDGTPADPEELREQLGEAVRGITGLMDEPLPARSIIMLVAEPGPEAIAGINFGDGIVIRPPDPQDAGQTERNIAHEVAHYYWRGNAPWIDEGMAEHIASLLESQRTGRDPGTNRWPCDSHRTLRTLPEGEEATACDYSLGSRIFMGLQLELGEPNFMARARDLYRRSRTHDRQDGTSLRMKDLRSLFPTHDHGDEGGTHSDDNGVLDFWEKGEGSPGQEQFDDTPPDARLRGLKGRLGPVQLIVDDQPWEILEGSRKNREAWVQMEYAHGDQEEGEFHLEFLTLHQDGIPITGPSRTVRVQKGSTGGNLRIRLGPDPGGSWANGRYVTYVYEYGRKVGETHWIVR